MASQCRSATAEGDLHGNALLFSQRAARKRRIGSHWSDALQGWVSQHAAVFAIVGAVFIVVVVSFVISWWSGWALLAREFRAPEPFRGKRRRWVSGRMRWLAGYHNCLVVGANPEGLYLSLVFLPFFHPPLFIPWTEIQVSDRRLMFGGIRFELGNDLHLPISLYRLLGNIGDDLQQDAGAGWPSGSAARPL
jgi:hypothetical protein